MKTLEKALSVLEAVSAANGAPRTPTEIAMQLELNLSSCTRMMQTLTRRGYLVQLSRRTGYITGPAVAALGCRRNRYGELAEAARDPVRTLARQLRAMVNLSTVSNDRRYILYHFGYTPGIAPGPVLAPPWNYRENATERLLLAALPREERRRIIRRIGPADDFVSPTAFEAALDDDYRNRQVKFHSVRQGLWIGGVLCEVPGYPNSALGFGVPTEAEIDPALAAAQACAAAIRANLAAGQQLP